VEKIVLWDHIHEYEHHYGVRIAISSIGAAREFCNMGIEQLLRLFEQLAETICRYI